MSLKNCLEFVKSKGWALSLVLNFVLIIYILLTYTNHLKFYAEVSMLQNQLDALRGELKVHITEIEPRINELEKIVLADIPEELRTTKRPIMIQNEAWRINRDKEIYRRLGELEKWRLSQFK